MLKDLSRAVITGVIVFSISVAFHQFVGVYNVNFTRHPVQEDTAVYLALGLLLGMRVKARQTGNSLLTDLRTAASFCVVAFILSLFLHQWIGVYDFNVNFTRFPLEEDAAVCLTIGHYFGQRWDERKVTKA